MISNPDWVFYIYSVFRYNKNTEKAFFHGKYISDSEV